MSTATFAPAAVAPHLAPHSGATAATGAPPTRSLGNALRAVKAFTGAAFGVLVLGEYGEEAGVRRR